MIEASIGKAEARAGGDEETRQCNYIRMGVQKMDNETTPAVLK